MISNTLYLGYNPILLSLDPKLLRFWPLEAFSWFLYSFDKLLTLWLFVSEHFFTFATSKWSRLIQYTPSLSYRIIPFSKKLSFICWIMVLETQIWAPGLFLVPGVLLLLGLLSWQRKNMYGCVLNCVYTHTFNFFLCKVADFLKFF